MERKWSLVEGKEGKKIGKQGHHLRVELKKKRISTRPKSLQEGSDRDDLIGESVYLWRKPKFWRARRGPTCDEHKLGS